MSSTIIVISIVLLIGILLIAGAPLKPMKFLANGAVKVVIGVLFIFFFNVFGASMGLHIPINVFTALISGFLGLPGLASLVAIHLFVL
ncbi:pro-sigmaK processing inhibitor BofA family protein [Pontibacillus sp. HMF3514]|uniref:pro-sigmaK processing inhibitor BofA family protein n=1 Tax=Pontibacillus sp. HMF3514 TaxID=2692425 RepID=UPI0013205724|nr:pro-sigmaK processing inhibitor BofA family protein [Pontibacillus sp. HMF3514]QHE50604.1 pro-sigmaK processing inhibitor BofA [Pontibacillus sp. HMF3514]